MSATIHPLHPDLIALERDEEEFEREVSTLAGWAVFWLSLAALIFALSFGIAMAHAVGVSDGKVLKACEVSK